MALCTVLFQSLQLCSHADRTAQRIGLSCQAFTTNQQTYVAIQICFCNHGFLLQNMNFGKTIPGGSLWRRPYRFTKESTCAQFNPSGTNIGESAMRIVIQRYIHAKIYAHERKAPLDDGVVEGVRVGASQTRETGTRRQKRGHICTPPQTFTF